MTLFKSKYFSTFAIGTLGGVVVFWFVASDMQYQTFSNTLWGSLAFLLWGGAIATMCRYLLENRNFSSAMQLNVASVILSIFSLLLFTTGNAWLSQKGDSELLAQLSAIQKSIEQSRSKIENMRLDWDKALLQIEHFEKSVKSIEHELVLAVSLHQVKKVLIITDSMKRNILNAKNDFEMEQLQGWNERVFVRSAYPFYLQYPPIKPSPAVIKNPVNSRPYQNNIIAIIYDGHIRND